MYEVFEHTADVGLRVEGPSLEALLAEAARGLLGILVANPESVRPVQQTTITLPAAPADELLFDWLNEVIFRFDTELLLLAEFDIQLTADGLRASCRGEQAERGRHQLDHEVKAVTYHQLDVRHVGERWQATVILDI